MTARTCRRSARPPSKLHCHHALPQFCLQWLAIAAAASPPAAPPPPPVAASPSAGSSIFDRPAAGNCCGSGHRRHRRRRRRRSAQLRGGGGRHGARAAAARRRRERHAARHRAQCRAVGRGCGGRRRPDGAAETLRQLCAELGTLGESYVRAAARAGLEFNPSCLQASERAHAPRYTHSGSGARAHLTRMASSTGGRGASSRASDARASAARARSSARGRAGHAVPALGKGGGLRTQAVRARVRREGGERVRERPLEVRLVVDARRQGRRARRRRPGNCETGCGAFCWFCWSRKSAAASEHGVARAAGGSEARRRRAYRSASGARAGSC